MDAEPVTIPAGISALQAYDDYFLRYHGWDWFAVVEGDGQFVGLAHRAAVEHAALDEGGAMPVRDVVAAAATTTECPPTSPWRRCWPPSRCAGWARSWPWTPRAGCAAW